MVRSTQSTYTTKQVLDLIPFINQTGLDNLSKSSRVKRKKFGKSFQYETKSVNTFLNSFNIDKYKTVSETTEILIDNGIRDLFKFFGDENGKKKCKYIRFTKEFPMSVKNLIENGYLKIDTDIKPTLIKYESIVSTIKYFSTKPKIPKKHINNTQSIESKLNQLLKRVG